MDSHWIISLLIVNTCLLLASNASSEDQDRVTGRPKQFSASQIDTLLNEHNRYRRSEGSSNMEKMTWSDSLAETASKAASRCDFWYTQVRHNPEFGYFGENIWVTTDFSGFSISKALASWYSERKHYNYTTMNCTSICGDYTQMVWARTRALGCGVRYCDKVTSFSNRPGYIFFCQYGPGGNWLGVKPFKKGDSCTQCSRWGPHCDDGLCSLAPPDDSVTSSAASQPVTMTTATTQTTQQATTQTTALTTKQTIPTTRQSTTTPTTIQPETTETTSIAAIPDILNGIQAIDRVTDQQTELSAGQARRLTDVHNSCRRREHASNMEKMTWSESLAETAQAAANTCAFEHTPVRRNHEFQYFGENIWVTGSTMGFSISKAVESWYSERKYYDYKTLRCNGICGHYTQVVWARSKALGCGVSYCGNIKRFGDRSGYILFCQYGPGGNYMGAKPYLEGPHCAQCPLLAPHCDLGLCSPSKAIISLTDTSDGNSETALTVAPDSVAMVTTQTNNIQDTGTSLAESVESVTNQTDLSLDAVCQRARGDDSFFCMHPLYYMGAPARGDELCRRVYCSVSSTQGWCQPVKVPDGVTCDIGKVCKDETCTEDLTKSTSSSNPSCLHGDQKYIYNYKRLRMTTCIEAIRDVGLGKAICVSMAYQRQCCMTCSPKSQMLFKYVKK